MKKLLILVLFLAFTVVGCGKDKTVQQQAEQKKNGAITIASISLPPSLDPAKGMDSFVNRLQTLMGETLVDFDNQTFQYVPALAKEWEEVDSKIFTFTLRDDVKFHNGKTVTSQDVKFSFEKLLDPKVKADAASYLSIIEGASDKLEGKAAEVKGIKVIDNNTIEFTLKYPQASFIGLLTYPAYSVVDKDEVVRLKDGYGKPENIISGAGKYKIVSLTDKELKLTRFDDFYGNRPQIKDLTYIKLPTKKDSEEIDKDKVIEMFNNNQLHCIITMSKIPELKQYESELVKPGTAFFHLNFDKDLWQNKNLRKAVYYAIDKEKLSSIINFQAADGFIPKAMPGYKPAEGKSYDVELAKTLLKEAGFPEGKGLPVIEIHDKPYGEPDNLIGPEIKNQLEKIGIKSKVVIENDFDYTRFEKSSDIMITGWVSDYPDISSMLEPVIMSDGPSNSGHYKNEQIDTLLKQAQRESNNNKRLELYNDVNKIIHEEAPIVPYGWVKKIVYINPKLQGVKFEFNDELVVDGLWLR